MSGWDGVNYRYEPSSLFEETFRCLPFGDLNLETGNKIIMPPSSLSLLHHRGASFPLFFKITTFNSDKTSHCGVLEFTAEEGFVYMPRWMMENLRVEDGEDVILRNVTLSDGNYIKLQPHATAFVEVSNPTAVLETALRWFACLSSGDTILVKYNERDYFIDVLDVRPGGEAVSLIGVDVDLEFERPLDYVEPPPLQRDILKREIDHVGEKREGVVKEFRPFTGAARRIDGTEVMVKSAAAAAVGEGERGSEKYWGKSDERVKKEGDDQGRKEEVRVFQPFVGAGRRLLDGSGCSAPAPAVVGKKREKDGGKDEAKEKFKPFQGRGRVLGGPFFD